MGKEIGLVWEDLPEKKTGLLGALRPILEQLKERPNTWARIGKWDGGSGAYEARKSLGKMDLPGNYAFEVRRTEEGSLLYAQFKGDRASVPIPRRP